MWWVYCLKMSYRPGPGRVLQPEHRLRVEEMGLTLATPLVLTADRQQPVRERDAVGRIGRQMPPADLLGQLGQPDAAQLAGRSGEVAVDQIAGQAERLEDLGAGVGGDGRDAHLAHHLEHALAQRLDDVRDGLLRLDAGVDTAASQVLGRLDRQVRVHRRRAVADQQRDVMHLADVAGLDHQADLGAALLPDEVVVDGGGEQQRRDRCQLGVGMPVGQHDDARATVDRRRDVGAELLELGCQRLGAAVHLVQPTGDVGRITRQITVPVDLDDLGQLVVGQHRERQHQPAAGRRTGIQQVPLRTDGVVERGDELLADRVQRRVGDLGEQLGEVVEEQPRLVAQRGDRRVGAHRADGLDPVGRHRRQDQPQLLLGVAEDLLAPGHRGVRVHDVLPVREVGEQHPARHQPFPVRRRVGKACLHLRVGDDPVLAEIDEEHLARLQPALLDDPVRRYVEHAGFGGEHHQAVVGDPEPAGAQAVAVQHPADLGAVGEDNARRPVPGLHQAGVEGVEVLLGLVDLLVVLPRLRDHHQHRVGE